MTSPMDPQGQPPAAGLPAPADPYVDPAAPTSHPAGYGAGVPPVSYAPQAPYTVPAPYGTQGPYSSPAYPVPYPGYPAYDPATGVPFSHKSKVVAGVLQLVLGAFGAGRFYTGHVGMAIAQIAVTWLTCGLGSIWPLIDGILLLVQGGTDSDGRVLRP